MSYTYKCQFCGRSISGSVSWSSGGSEYSCESCAQKAKRSYESAVKSYESRKGGGSGCAVVAFLVLGSPVLALMGAAWALMT